VLVRAGAVYGALAGVAALAVLAAVGPAAGGGTATRLVDRTLLCKPVAEGFPDPSAFLDLTAVPKTGKGSPLVAAFAEPSGKEEVSAQARTGPDDRGLGTGYASFSRYSCSTATVRIPLTASGLRRELTDRSVTFRCLVPGRILLRLRAEFARPAALKTFRNSWLAKGHVSKGQLAVATYKGRKPIAFASVDDRTGKPSLFTAPSRCNEP
jgi:hypothetical protein